MSRTPLDTTSAYYRALPGVAALRFALSATQRFWPALAVRAASRLFLTPLPPKWLNRGKHWARQWRIERWPFDGVSITLYSQPSNGKVVLLVHGWGGHAGQMRSFVNGHICVGQAEFDHRIERVDHFPQAGSLIENEQSQHAHHCQPA